MKPIRTAILTASYACLAFLHVSCVREDTGDCMQYEIHVRVVDAAGNDLTQSGVLEKSEVYLFGENGFVRMVPAGVSSDYLFGNHKEARLTLVAWGNIKEDTLITAKIKPGTLLEEARLKLKQHAEGSHLPVTDLFYCRKELNNTATRSIQEEKITLVMKRMAAGLSIRTRYLAERYPYQGETYTFIVRPFRIFPTQEEECIEVEIYRGQEKLCTITQDNELHLLRAEAGKQTDIEIDFRKTEIRVFVKVLPWGEVEQETEM